MNGFLRLLVQWFPSLAPLLKLGGNKTKSYTFQALPTSVAELQALPEASMQDPYAVAALSVLALCQYKVSPETCFQMMNALMGPDPISNLAKSQVNDRLAGKTYKPYSYICGATPANNYQPAQPYVIKVSSNPYSFQNEGWATLYLTSGGGDNPRPVRLRQKPSTGQWFLVEVQYLGDIRLPAAEDKWR